MRKLLLFICLCAGLVSGCREPFEPEIKPSDESVLVVEGYLDSEGLASYLYLSYARPIQGDGLTGSYTVSGARIRLESETGEEYYLADQGSGSYLFQEDISENQNYQLFIETPDGLSYVSDPIRPIISPEIQDVGFVRNEEGVEIFLTTQGDQNADDFLWTFEETWAFRPRIVTPYIYRQETKTVEFRTPEERIDLCFKSELNSDLILETSSRFEDQFVFRQSITHILEGDEKLSQRYSILISQKALDQGAAEFWEIMRKNSSDLGSIFSPLPSNVSGNLHQEQDPNAPVVGYVSLGVVRQERLFVDFRDVLPWRLDIPEEYLGCLISADSTIIADYDAMFRTGETLPAREYVPDGGTQATAYFTAPRRCADCTLRGTREKPEFWEDF
ncbi:DUF4249 domain-containing protein [Algoriphagus halophytocola]|uniref:DUF4249 domain-containing protein n=1 Tax=Algoriphagus halophytocola TaxID=2991499 RepID=A0ABY6MED9_9BACT|nr:MULTISPECIES: DUF4249 domain-containing protein [unclassified Algoriphagus]UZD22160.1 DUF4249 domain-containing protein [Algoriphagus sp. TR-M5]WBL43411.1 DUF4249 domain-containing protein [Algoriphagus sp. TR-M9]